MVEGVMAWLLMFIGFAKMEADWFIASGVFAVALQIHRLREEGVNNER